jgi:hypothetical protein
MIDDARREALRLRENQRRELAHKQAEEACAECGGWLAMRHQMTDDGVHWWLECAFDKGHQGTKKPKRIQPPYGVSYMKGDQR